MVGPLGKIIAQAVILGVSVLTRALPAAYAQAVANARKNGIDTAARAVSRRGGMELDQAGAILNLKDGAVLGAVIDAAEVKKQFERYHAANAVDKGGSFYLQSKVYRARELLDEHIKEMEMEKANHNKQEDTKKERQ